MKLLYIHDRLGDLAGAEANARITAGELARRGHQLGLLHGPGTGRGEENWEQIFSHRYAISSTPVESTRHALAEFKPDAVYVHKMSDLGVLSTLMQSSLPRVHMVHDHDIYCLRSYKYNPLSRKICTRAASAYCVFPCMGCVVRDREGLLPLKLRSFRDKLQEIELNKQFDRMVVVTTYMRDELLRNGFDPQRISIHAPVPRMGDASIQSSFSDRNLILYAGQITRGKGVDVLLRALAKVQSRFECIILGDGHHKAACEKLSRKLGLQDRVTFKGFIPQEELKAYYRECSVVALSSVWPEPIATIGLEVMRYGLPVVAFDAGGIKDWLIDGENGRLVPWMDTAAYASALDELLRDKSKAQAMGQAGLRLVSERYDFEGYITGLEQLFAEVVSEQRPASTQSMPQLPARDPSADFVVPVPATP